MSAKYLQQILVDDLTSSNFKNILQVLHEDKSLSPDELSECLLYYVRKICPRVTLPENIVKMYIPYVNEYTIIYMLLDSGADIDKLDAEGNTCLFYAASSGNRQLCDVLLQCGADMWANTEYGIPICDFVSKESASEDLIATFNKFYPGLWRAVECEDIYQVRQLINYWCRTSLHKNGLNLKDIALETGNEEIINLILGVCESMDLVYHIYAHNIEAIKKKLEISKRKIRLNLRKMSDNGAPILYYLIQSRDVPVIELFIKHDCQIYTIMRDNMGNDMPVLFTGLTPDMSVEVFEALLPKYKTQVEDILYKILYKGMTVLEVAMEKRVSPEIFKLLIDRGGPLLLCDHNQFNETVLDVAISLDYQPYVDAIDECVFDWIHNPSKFNNRRLKLALLGWRFEPVQYMENEIDDENKNTTNFLSIVNDLQTQIKDMSLAIEDGDFQKFSSLKSAVYSNQVCEANMLWHARVVGDGMPLLHRAVLFDRPEIVDNILEDKPLKESIDNFFDQYHRTALHYAYACSKAKKIQRLLLNCGCSEHVLDKTNKEPLDFKDKQDSTAIIEMIEHLKSKNYSDCESDIWNTGATDDPTECLLQRNEINCDNTEDFHGDCNNCYEYHEVAYQECDEIELENSSDETASEDEEENHSRCLIS